MISRSKLAFGAGQQFSPIILVCAHNHLINAIKALLFFVAMPAVVLRLPEKTICTDPPCDCQHPQNAPTV